MASAAASAAAVATAAIAAAAIAAAACGSPTDVVVAGDADVRVRATADSVRVENVSGEPVFAATFGAELSTLIDWYPCANASQCPPIPAGGVRSVARPTFRGQPEREAVVYWWRIDARSAADLARPDSVRAVRVRFP